MGGNLMASHLIMLLGLSHAIRGLVSSLVDFCIADLERDLYNQLVSCSPLV